MSTQDQTDVSFEISNLTLKITVNEDFKSAVFRHHFKLKKIRLKKFGNDNWTYSTDTIPNKCKEPKIFIKENGVHRSLGAIPIEDNGKTTYQIDFGKEYNVDEYIDFYIEIEKPIKCKLTEKGIFYTRFLMFTENKVDNYCERIENIFKFSTNNTKIISHVPGSYEYNTENREHLFFKNRIYPGELFTVCVLVERGYLSQKASRILSWLLMAILGGLVSSPEKIIALFNH